MTLPNGLSTTEAKKRLEIYGPNSMPSVSPSLLLSALGKFWAPIPWMLEAVILIELLVHDNVEALVIAVLLVFNAMLSFFRESRAQATLNALKSRLALTASVRRDGVWSNIDAAGLVDGDIIKLSLGGVVPADVRLLDGSVLLDQSMITGESIPIEASANFQTFAGALVRRGEAIAEVTLTGARTKFGKTAELIRTAHVESSQQKVVLRVVRNLALFNACIIILLLTYAITHALPLRETISLILTAVLSSIPVALPATFTLAAAVGASALAKLGVLPTRLSAVDEAATMDVLCVDKTGTLTQNHLKVTVVRSFEGFDDVHVLGFAALASSEGGQDPVDAAIRAAGPKEEINDLPKITKFFPFDSAKKMSEATATDAQGNNLRIIKGAFNVVVNLAKANPTAISIAEELEAKGYRVLAVAVGSSNDLKLAGLIALSDPPRADSAELIAQLRTLGVRTIMLTGDAPATAAIVAHAVGIEGAVWPPGPLPKKLDAKTFGVYASILPEDKDTLVKAFQESGHTVGMCGDGANDAPALRQAQMGIAVSTATDVAKSAAGIVLTEPGLRGILASVNEGRSIFQRILTYILKSVTHKFVGTLFLGAGILMTGHAILTPKLLVISMVTGDFLSMLSATDNVHVSPTPNIWRVGSLTLSGIALGLCDLLFCVGVLAIGKYRLGFDLETLRTLSIVTLVFSGQAILYVVRERRHFWSSCPSGLLMVSSFIDLLIISTLANRGIFMSPLSLSVIVPLFFATLVFGLLLDVIKIPIFKLTKII